MKRVSERAIIFLVGAVQFVNILDFMIVTPLGPDFARGLGIPTSRLGIVVAAYTAAAAAAGIAGAFFLDRFDRRKALAVAMGGLVLGTAACAGATDLDTLVAARVLAGAFGGPATSIALSIVADVIPPERRGKAMAAVMGAFSAASVLGVPTGLWLARELSWRHPFFAVALLGVVVTALTVTLLPPLRGHLDRQAGKRPPSFVRLISRPAVLLSYTMTAVTMMGGFLLIPNIPTYLLVNLEYPRARFELLYLVGGAVTFGSMRLVGKLVDHWGSFRVGTAFSILLATVLYVGFVDLPAWLPIAAIFVAFMIAMTSRNVSYNTLTSKVPYADERARFMSFQSAIGHIASALGAWIGSQLLTERLDHSLVGIDRLAWMTICLTGLLPGFLWIVERKVAQSGRAPVEIASRPPAPEAE